MRVMPRSCGMYHQVQVLSKLDPMICIHSTFLHLMIADCWTCFVCLWHVFAIRQYVSITVQCLWQIVVPCGCVLPYGFCFIPVWLDGHFLLDNTVAVVFHSTAELEYVRTQLLYIYYNDLTIVSLMQFSSCISYIAFIIGDFLQQKHPHFAISLQQFNFVCLLMMNSMYSHRGRSQG